MADNMLSDRYTIARPGCRVFLCLCWPLPLEDQNHEFEQYCVSAPITDVPGP